MDGAPRAKPGLVERWKAVNARGKALVEEYGAVAVVMLLVLSVVNVGAFYAALRLGFAGSVGNAATLATAYAASRATKPFAAMAAIALTPTVARAWRRLRR